MGSLIDWLLDPLDSHDESANESRDEPAKCHMCGTYLGKGQTICPICGFVVEREDRRVVRHQPANVLLPGEGGETAEGSGTAEDWTRAENCYLMAREECRKGRNEEAIVSLREACRLDGFYATLAGFERDLKPLRTDTRFQELIKSRSEELKETPNPQYYSKASND